MAQKNKANLTSTLNIAITDAMNKQNTSVNVRGILQDIIDSTASYDEAFTGATDTYWTSGSTGNYSIKANNDTPNDATGSYSVAEGAYTIAIGDYSHAEGNTTLAIGAMSHSEGEYTNAVGLASHSEGSYTSAIGYDTHAEGRYTIAIGDKAHSEGLRTTAIGENSHAEGQQSIAKGLNSHSEGNATQAIGNYSHSQNDGTIAGAMAFVGDTIVNGLITINSYYGDVTTSFNVNGNIYLNDTDFDNIISTKTAIISAITFNSTNTLIQLNTTDSSLNTTQTYVFDLALPYQPLADAVIGDGSHSEGKSKAYGFYSHAQNFRTLAIGDNSTSEGLETTAIGSQSHCEGSYTIAAGNSSHVEGDNSQALGNTSHAEGEGSIASGSISHAEGDTTIASGDVSHAEGGNTEAQGAWSHAEGRYSIAIGDTSHSEGDTTTASGLGSHSEGGLTTASGLYSHSEGDTTTASGNYSHSEGAGSIASGERSHAEGGGTIASGYVAHAEGAATTASGYYSHSEGSTTTASGDYSHAGGYLSIASGAKSFVHGNNSLAGGNCTTVFGNGITGTTANTVYVPNLNINIVGTGTSINNLGVDASGNVVVGSSGSTFTGQTLAQTLAIGNSMSSGQNILSPSGYNPITNSDTYVGWEYSNPANNNGEISTDDSQNTFYHDALNQFNAPIHQFNNTIKLLGGASYIDLTYDGNAETLLSIANGSDYGGIVTGDQKVILNYNTGLVEIYSDASNRLIVSRDNNEINLISPSVKINSATGNTLTYYDSNKYLKSVTIGSGLRFSAGTLSLTASTSTSFTGGTVTGTTNFTNGLTANTFSATTYLNLPIDVRVTGGTYSNGTTTLTNNTGGTFNIVGFYTGSTDISITGLTYNNANILTLTNNTGGTLTTVINTMTGLTVNGSLSASSITANTYTVNPVIGLSATTAQTINLTLSDSFSYTVTGNTTFTFSNNANGKSWMVAVNTNPITSGYTGSFTATTASVKWQNSVTPVLTTAVSKTDVFAFSQINGTIYGAYVQNF